MATPCHTTESNDVQFRFRNWNWNRISRIFRDGGIGIGIELKPKLLEGIGQSESEWNPTNVSWGKIGIGIELNVICPESESTFAGIAHH